MRNKTKSWNTYPHLNVEIDGSPHVNTIENRSSANNLEQFSC